MDVREALHKRISVRAFKSDPVPFELMRSILDDARYAPSGGNIQAWRMIAVAGAERDAVVSLAHKNMAGDNPFTNEADDYPVYPANLWDPYRTRRFKIGEDMYAKMGVPREDKPARLRHVARNFEFFGAPVGLFFIIDKRMGHGQWAHLGMLMQSVALAAIDHGVSSCFQEAWANHRGALHKHFGLGEHEMIYAGMALGYPDDSAPVNSLRSDRASLEEIVEFKGF
jgi:nitroreductase